MKAPGKLVPVNDTEMHVYSIPSDHADQQGTIIFLAGSGTGCPTYDFKPLWYQLKGKCNMAVVERPGYGWSGTTQRPRDIDTLLEETREALKNTGIIGPFIPAAHSLSGLEAIYWAQKYPDEISAIIGLDMAVPSAYDKMELPRFFHLIVKISHLLRTPAARSMVKHHPAVKNKLLTEEEQTAMRHILSRQMLSQNMVDEVGFVKENARKVASESCPAIPLLCYLSTDAAMLKQYPGWGKFQRDYWAENSQARFIDLACGHYVHTEEPKKIAEGIIQQLF